MSASEAAKLLRMGGLALGGCMLVGIGWKIEGDFRKWQKKNGYRGSKGDGLIWDLFRDKPKS